MRMLTKFLRRVGGSGAIPLLGSDGGPGVPPTGTPGDTAANANSLSQALASDQGWPGHRIAVAYKGPSMALALVGQFWVYDFLTEGWYEVGAPVTMTPNRIAYFDTVALINTRASTSDPDRPTTQGALEGKLVVQPAGGDPSGTYTFAMAADLTTLP